MFIRLALQLASVISLSTGTLSSNPSENVAGAAIQRMQDGYIGAWRKASAVLIAANFTEDGDFINPNGFHAVGRAAIAKFYARAFAAGYSGSDAGFTPRLSHLIAPGVLVIDGEWFIVGAHRPDGQPQGDEHGLATAVLVKTKSGWRITALREQSSGAKISD